MLRIPLLRASAAIAVTASLASAAWAQDVPRQMMWSSYDVGSSGHSEASAVADALMKGHETRVRILPSGTSIGRLLPLKTGRVQYGWLANEVYFATEAIYDFASREWGPQDLRVVLGRPAAYGLATAADANIKTAADLKGKRVAYIKANPSIGVKNDAILAFAGLTRDDVVVVEEPSYAAALRAVVEGRADAAGGVPTSGLMREIEASPRGLAWLDIDPDNAEGWKKLRSVASFFAPVKATVGAGLSEDKPSNLIAYRYPMITVYANKSDDEIYAMTKAVVEAFPQYKDATKIMPMWEAKHSGVPPADAPYHPGAVRYLKEIGVWTAEHDAWNDARLARLQAVQKAWDAATEKSLDEQVKDSDWPAYWDKYRAENLK